MKKGFSIFLILASIIMVIAGYFNFFNIPNYYTLSIILITASILMSSDIKFSYIFWSALLILYIVSTIALLKHMLFLSDVIKVLATLIIAALNIYLLVLEYKGESTLVDKK